MKLVVNKNIKSKKNNKIIGYRNTRNGRKPFIMTDPDTRKEMDEIVEDLAKQFEGLEVTNYPVCIQFVFYYQHKHRKDLDNSTTTMLDCLTEAGILKDDDVQHIDELHASFGGYDKENPRVEIYLED